MNWKLLALSVFAVSLLGACEGKKEEQKPGEATTHEAGKPEEHKAGEAAPAEAPKEEPKAEQKAS
ncbi:MAG: hypothetical protein K2Y18_04495 [Alphaproteobacteria bacterium]|jgi:hypothetical protein|nr:hypothetical protein [Alphaproteobacteria bacterium]